MSDVEKLFTNFSKREIEFASFILSHIDSKILITENRSVLENQCRKLNINNAEVLSRFNITVKESLINERELDWLKSDLRAQLFSWNFLHTNDILRDTQYTADFFENFKKQIDFCYHNPFETFQGYPSSGYYIKPMSKQAALCARLAVSPQLTQPSPQPQNIPDWSNQPILNQPFTQSQNIPGWSNQSRNYDNNQVLDNFLQTLNFKVAEKTKGILSSFNLFRVSKTEEKNTNWINQNDEVQMYWVTEYLKKSGVFLKPTNLLAKDNEIYIQILASLDTLGENESANKKLFISNMRKAWSQKKFRDKKTLESAQDILLSKKSKKQLIELCKTTGFTPVNMLEYLIEQEYEQK